LVSRRQALVADVGRAVQAYQRSTQAFDDEVGRILGLNPADLRSLDWLSEGPMTASRLAEATGLSAAATTAMIDRLERKGFVVRRRDAGDRRQVLVEMTETGADRVGALYGPLAAEGSPLLARFTTQELEVMRDQLVDMRDVTDRHRARLRSMDAERS
jgi:DNA-binding MarR family transcriptional regulator